MKKIILFILFFLICAVGVVTYMWSKQVDPIQENTVESVYVVSEEKSEIEIPMVVTETDIL